MLNIAGQAGTDAQKSTNDDCTNVKPQIAQNPMLAVVFLFKLSNYKSFEIVN